MNTKEGNQAMQKRHWSVVIRRLCAGVMLTVSTALGATIRNVPADYNTIQAAHDACVPGDTVLVAEGTYYEQLWLSRTGTASAPITLKAVNNGGAVIDAQNLPSAAGVYHAIYIGPRGGHSGSYNVVRGFEIKNGYHNGIFIDNGSSHNKILMNNIHHNGGAHGGSGIFSDPATAGNSYIGNYIYDNGLISTTSNQDHGLYLCGDDELVMNNLIVRNCAFGIHIAGYQTVSNLKIYNNTVVSSRNQSGMVLWMTVNGIDIANNIFYGNASYAVATFECDGSGVQIRNNLLFANGADTWDMGSTVSYTTNENSTTSDPLFVNSTSDWHLQRCSPAIDSGVTLSIVTGDYDGLPRPIGAGHDIGAYER